MEQQEPLVLEPLLHESYGRRRDLLPIWIKVFIWFFMIMGAMAPIVIIAALFGTNLHISIYGLTSNIPLSPLGLFLSLLFLLKGITAYSLWTEQQWSIVLAIADALIGIIVCACVMLVFPFWYNQSGFSFSFRLELVLLIPYLVKLQRIKTLWQHRDAHLLYN